MASVLYQVLRLPTATGKEEHKLCLHSTVEAKPSPLRCLYITYLIP